MPPQPKQIALWSRDIGFFLLKTLANPDDKKLILERVANLRCDSPRAWGKMSAHQMMCHLCDSFRSKLGSKVVRSRANLFTKTVMKWFALRAPVPWPHGIGTPPELDQQIGGTPPEDFEKDRRELIALTEQFTSQSGKLDSAAHVFFGRMTVEEWMRWAWLHMDHHLRQFNC